MDQIAQFSNTEFTNENIKIAEPEQNEHYSNFSVNKAEQPKIVLNENEKIENIAPLGRIQQSESIKSIKKLKETFESNQKTFTLEEVQKLLNSVKETKKPVVEKFASMYEGQPEDEYNEDSKFTNQSYKPLGQNGNGFTNAWDHDYILLNTDKWAPALNPPPVCKTEKTCPVCPNLTTGYPLMVRDFDSTRKITPDVNANLKEMNA